MLCCMSTVSCSHLDPSSLSLSPSPSPILASTAFVSLPSDLTAGGTCGNIGLAAPIALRGTSGMCLDAAGADERTAIKIKPCDPAVATQKFNFGQFGYGYVRVNSTTITCTDGPPCCVGRRMRVVESRCSPPQAAPALVPFAPHHHPPSVKL